MTLEYRRSTGGYRSTVMTECPGCEQPLADNEGLAEHLPDCPAYGGDGDAG